MAKVETSEMELRQGVALADFIAEWKEVGRVRYDGTDVIVTTLDGEWRIDERGEAEHLVGPVKSYGGAQFRAAARESGTRWTVETRASEKESWSAEPRRFRDVESAEDHIDAEIRKLRRMFPAE